MAGKKRKKVREKDVEGLKYFDKMTPLLERLHEVGCERDSAGNRRVHMDQYCSLVLPFLFNPICGLLRAIQQASELEKVQRKVGCPWVAMGSLSESVGVLRIVTDIPAVSICRAPSPRASIFRRTWRSSPAC